MTRSTLTPADLDEIPDVADRLRQIFAEGIVHPARDPKRLPYPGWSRGELLVHLALTHTYGHSYEVCTVCSLLGVSFWA
jgi:hypothetical protein